MAQELSEREKLDKLLAGKSFGYAPWNDNAYNRKCKEDIMKLIDQAVAEARIKTLEQLASHHYQTQPSDYGNFNTPGVCIICGDDSYPCRALIDIRQEEASQLHGQENKPCSYCGATDGHTPICEREKL